MCICWLTDEVILRNARCNDEILNSLFKHYFDSTHCFVSSLQFVVACYFFLFQAALAALPLFIVSCISYRTLSSSCSGLALLLVYGGMSLPPAHRGPSLPPVHSDLALEAATSAIGALFEPFHFRTQRTCLESYVL